MSFFGQMVNMVTPARRTVLREPQTTFSDPTYAPDPMTGELRGEVERSVTPGLYGKPEFGMSYMPIARAPGKALDYLSSFITEPETRSAALEGIQSLPEAVTRRMRVSEEAAQGGMSEVYDPSTVTLLVLVICCWLRHCFVRPERRYQLLKWATRVVRRCLGILVVLGVDLVQKRNKLLRV